MTEFTEDDVKNITMADDGELVITLNMEGE